MRRSGWTCGMCSMTQTYDCFTTKEELQEAVKQVVTNLTAAEAALVETYGWPIAKWCLTSNITDLSNLFEEASDFNEELSEWNTSSVMDMSYMFNGASSFNSDLSTWDTSSVIDMNHMFHSAFQFNSDISAWNVSQVTDMTDMFYSAASFNRDLCPWGSQLYGKSVDVSFMWAGASSCPKQFPPDLLQDPPGPFCYNCIS